jgi:hypothetical protein
MAGPHSTPPVSPLYGLWLAVFAIDASLAGRGLEHQLGALALGLLFTGLLWSEVVSHRRANPRPTYGDTERRHCISRGATPPPAR